MSWNLPPLSALRVFEAAARLGGFTRAAEELGMTQSAVSYQIKLLEERMGAPLFVRGTRRVDLTEAGEMLAPQATRAFSALADAWTAVKGGASGVLAVTSINAFASNWLAVRLGAFQLAHPDLTVKVDASNRLVDFTRENVDVGIRKGGGDWPGLTAHYLFGADYTPMLSPRLAESVGGIHKPEDLYKVALLCADYRWWPSWFEAVGIRYDPGRVVVGARLDTETYDAMAAITEQGAAILTRNLYGDFVAQGQLMQPFEISASDGDGYWLVYLESRRNTPRIKAFRDWILDETAEIRAQERQGSDTGSQS